MSGKTSFYYKEMVEMLSKEYAQVRFVELESDGKDYLKWFKKRFNDKTKLRIKKIKSIKLRIKKIKSIRGFL